MERYEPMHFDRLIGMAGFSERMLKDHFTLYQGYVDNTNKLMQELAEAADRKKTNSPAYAEMKRRFGWEFNGMRMHELYFGNLAREANPLETESMIGRVLEKSFGSCARWEELFRAVASLRGIGWAALYYDPRGEQLFNVWINEHDEGHLSGCVPLLVLDAFEHAYLTDYGIKRAPYIDAFMKGIDWEAVSLRLEHTAMGSLAPSQA